MGSAFRYLSSYLAFCQGVAVLTESMSGLSAVGESLLAGSKEVLLVPISALKRGVGKAASARRAKVPFLLAAR